MGQRDRPRNRNWQPRELAELERLYIRLLAIKARLLEIKEHQEMSALFPTFTSIWQRAKQLLSTDTRNIWQALEASEQEIQATDFQPVTYLYW